VAEPGPVIVRTRLLAARIWALRSNLTTYGAADEQYGCALVSTGALITRATGTQCPVNLIS
jgi:hypothetical protein